MSDDGLRGTVTEFGDSQVKDIIHDRYLEKLKSPTVFGEPIGDGELGEVNTGLRKYDHGDASDRVVKEVGVKVVFDSAETDLQSLQPGGEIRRDLEQISQRHFTCELLDVDLTFVREDEYVVWLIADKDSLMD